MGSVASQFFGYSEPSEQPREFVLASRASKLAQIQTNVVIDALRDAFPTSKFSTSFMSTAGDKNQSQALYLLGGKSLWTKELEVALLQGEVDMLVHSLKDMPTVLPEGCALGAILERADAVDSLVVKAGFTVEGKEVKGLDDLPNGSVVGTSSVRRVAQLKRKYPHLIFKDVRGNLTTRLSKLDDSEGPYAALILAKAGLVRQGLGDRVTADIGAPTLYYAVGQGALGVEIRAGDAETIRLCKALTHWQTQWKCLAERACLRVLEGGCSVPVGMHTELEVLKDEGESSREARLRIVGTITAIDGQQHVEHEIVEVLTSTEDAEDVGARLARVLIETGGRDILQEIEKDRESRAGEEKTKEEVHKIEEVMQQP
ncbi:porphobilinogen deaminase [Dentipellis sp. KUC8613]|nr:porphobilinogen deaminase [Dentipellis sp. KUC8613]